MELAQNGVDVDYVKMPKALAKELSSWFQANNLSVPGGPFSDFEETLLPEKSWGVKDAKTHFSHLFQRALDKPQRIQHRDGSEALIVSLDTYNDLISKATSDKNIVDLFRAAQVEGPSLARLPKPRPNRVRSL